MLLSRVASSKIDTLITPVYELINTLLEEHGTKSMFLLSVTLKPNTFRYFRKNMAKTESL